jgi:hypothetical protein
LLKTVLLKKENTPIGTLYHPDNLSSIDSS